MITAMMKTHYAQNMPLSDQANALQSQIEALQSLEHASAEKLRTYQAGALKALMRHAHRYSTFWRTRLNKAGFTDQSSVYKVLQGLEPLTRADIQQQFEALRAQPPEMARTRIRTATSSGSTGSPVTIEKDMVVYSLFYLANSWIESYWHRRDARQKIAVITMQMEETAHTSWGGAFDVLGYRGPSVTRGYMLGNADSHLDWLLQEKPAYLKCNASIAAELAERSLSRGDHLPLVQIMSQTERVQPKQRALCLAAFGAPIADRYSCEEAGWLAFECPTHHHLHALSGTVLMEILDNNNQPCPPGTVGRVLITSLHSFAMPLIRYELGDLAEWGPACGCGVTLPVIAKLHGRIRNRVQLPGGSSAMPFLGDDLGFISSIRQFRTLQHPDLSLELQVAVSKTLDLGEIEKIHKIYKANGLGALNLRITELPEIPWPAGRKREEFVSMLAPGSGNSSIDVQP
jgi:phenylacetate-CoA ligase